ncbi:hypothetical protein K435DRAFT_480085 [Dendrothele bispora CBS 962.96]|uniref:Uncharacterized protein n=1 Tax=Dendrothele bispora (strain CBS 962.96) TaxID=1314807 RepID=A0A4S8MU63_DENBC|nr:hypothetical protein K435DRAFT_480085 [Dendrothele bispora CBS 962.96]
MRGIDYGEREEEVRKKMEERKKKPVVEYALIVGRARQGKAREGGEGGGEGGLSPHFFLVAYTTFFFLFSLFICRIHKRFFPPPTFFCIYLTVSVSVCLCLCPSFVINSRSFLP